MRLMGLDIGDKTIGVALSDPLFISAHGYETYMRVGIKADANYILKLCKEQEAGTIVCGLPLMLNGTDSPQTLKVREFVTRLENKARSMGFGPQAKIRSYGIRISRIASMTVPGTPLEPSSVATLTAVFSRISSYRKRS